jgi:hypothetical protein
VDRQRLEPLGVQRVVEHSEALQPVESAQNIFKWFLRVNPYHRHNQPSAENLWPGPRGQTA